MDIKIPAKDTEHRITVLLKLLGPELSGTLLEDLPAAKKLRLQQSIDRLQVAPPSESEVMEVLSEFDRFLRFAERSSQLAAAEVDDAGRSRPHSKSSTARQSTEMSDDPFIAINHVSNMRMVTALRDESPRTAALVLNAMDDDRGSEILSELPAEQRDRVVLELKEKLAPPQILMERLLRATIARCESFVEEELEAERESSDARVARLLKSMAPERRGEVLTMLEGADPEACERIRGTLFTFNDLLQVQDQTLQRILGEIDSGSLARALSTADKAIQDRVLSNMSKRARLSIVEEMEFMGNLPKAELEAAVAAVVTVMIELDKNGELHML